MSKSQRIIEKKRLYNEEGKIKCTECNEEKTLDNFNKSKSCLFGLKTKCKDCSRKKYETNRTKSYTYQKEEYKIKNETLLQIGRKICSKCRVEKSVNDFATNKKLKCGYSSQCYTCGNSKERKEKERQKRREKNPEYYDFIDEKKILLQQGKCRCYKCREIKSIEDYPNTKYISYCKECEYVRNVNKLKEEKLKKHEQRMKDDPVYAEKYNEKQRKYNEKQRKKVLLSEGKKECLSCSQILPMEDFENSRKYHCIKCNENKKKEYKKKYSEKQRKYKERQRKRHKQRMKDDPVYAEKYNEKQRKYYEKQRKRHKQRMKDDPVYAEKYNEKHRKKSRKRYHSMSTEEKRIERRKKEEKKRESDPLYVIKKRVSTLIRNSISRKGYSKESRTYEILGCSYEEFIEYIESQFEDWMSWDNHGKYNGEYNYGWDFDHIIPKVVAETEEDIIKLNHYTNFQPLCSKINRDIKNGKVNWSGDSRTVPLREPKE